MEIEKSYQDHYSFNHHFLCCRDFRLLGLPFDCYEKRDCLNTSARSAGGREGSFNACLHGRGRRTNDCVPFGCGNECTCVGF